MTLKTTLAAVAVTFVVALVPASAFGDPGGAVQADLTQLTNDVAAARTTLIADLQAITSDAQAGDRAAVRSDLARFRTDLASLAPPIKADRRRLRTDLRAARAAHVTGLGVLVGQSVSSDRTASSAIEQALEQARDAVRALRQAPGTSA